VLNPTLARQQLRYARVTTRPATLPRDFSTGVPTTTCCRTSPSRCAGWATRG
jgi:hypothetical protein